MTGAHAQGRARSYAPDGCRPPRSDAEAVQCFRWCPIAVICEIAGLLRALCQGANAFGP